MADNTQQSSTRYKLMTTFTPMSTLPERLHKILSEMEGPDHGKQSRLAALAGCKRAAITHYLKNPGSEIGYENAKNIADALNYNVDWLIMGRGSERIEGSSNPVAMTLHYVDAHEAEILTIYRGADNEGKDFILKSARLFKKSSPVAIGPIDTPNTASVTNKSK